MSGTRTRRGAARALTVALAAAVAAVVPAIAAGAAEPDVETRVITFEQVADEQIDDQHVRDLPVDDRFERFGLAASAGVVHRLDDGDHVLLLAPDCCLPSEHRFDHALDVRAITVEVLPTAPPVTASLLVRLEAYDADGALLDADERVFDQTLIDLVPKLRAGPLVAVQSVVAAARGEPAVVPAVGTPIDLDMHVETPGPPIASISFLTEGPSTIGLVLDDLALQVVRPPTAPSIELTGDFAGGEPVEVVVDAEADADGEIVQRSFAGAQPVITGVISSVDALESVVVEYTLPGGATVPTVLCTACGGGEAGDVPLQHPFFAEGIEPLDGLTVATIIATTDRGAEARTEVAAEVAVEVTGPPPAPPEPTDSEDPTASEDPTERPVGPDPDPPDPIAQLLAWLGDPAHGGPTALIVMLVAAIAALVLARSINSSSSDAQRRRLAKHLRVVVGANPAVSLGPPVRAPGEASTRGIRLRPHPGHWISGPITEERDEP
ncbi:hypothetical protein GCM10009819_08780 [Agromyces tropicus]|uniref:Uncharacterized protein n=1 Tax=Agromyces tropicus TaxID=555371 RepID=A0ABN2U3T9_9MICO